MLMEWLELVMWVLVALVVWLGAAVVIAQTESPASGERRAAPAGVRRRDAPTGTGPAQGPRLYKDVEHDHRDYGDEDPPDYIGHRCQKCGGRIFRARDGLRCHNCGLLAGRVAPPEGQMQTARPAHVESRRDGVQLSDEANAELLKDILGAEGPTC